MQINKKHIPHCSLAAHDSKLKELKDANYLPKKEFETYVAKVSKALDEQSVLNTSQNEIHKKINKDVSDFAKTLDTISSDLKKGL
jgi:hypothetical protein